MISIFYCCNCLQRFSFAFEESNKTTNPQCPLCHKDSDLILVHKETFKPGPQGKEDL